MACGIKTANRMLAVDPQTLQPHRTVLEAAMQAGMRTGVVTTDVLYGATPAGFTAHVADRSMRQQIVAQQLKLGPDVMMGGGRPHYLAVLNDTYSTKQPYRVVQTAAELDAANEIPLLGLFANTELTYQIDRAADNPEPYLPQMIAKAIRLLDNPKGFFLMVEGALIDVCAHNNDAACMFKEMLQFDAAAEVALDFARQNSHTVVIATADHDCGGLALGHNYANGSYPIQNWWPNVLLQFNASTPAMCVRMFNGEDPRAVVLESTGIVLSDDEVATMVDVLDRYRNSAGNVTGFLGRMLAYRALLGFSSVGHTAVDVNLYTSVPQGVQGLKGNINNIDIGQYMSHILNLNL